VTSKELGFVLKRFLPEKQKVAILTQYQGKINAVVKASGQIHTLWPGHLISYHSSSFAHGSADRAASICSIEQVEIIDLPLHGATEHFLWLHHLLEICYYFLSLENPCPEVFNHLLVGLEIVQDPEHRAEVHILKRAFLVKLFALLGFSPDKKLIPMIALFNQIIARSVDSKTSGALHSLQAQCNVEPLGLLLCADLWVLSCIKTHPNLRSFKTLKFLKGADVANNRGGGLL